MIPEEKVIFFKDLYRDFYNSLPKDYNQQEICPFFMQIGKDYGLKTPKCLFVGKATNGWVGETNNVEELFDKKNQGRIINRDDEIKWVEKHSGSKDKYNTNKSAFWRVIKSVSVDLFGVKEWYKYISWTNIYKFAFGIENPDGYLQRLQRNFSCKMLDEEIKYLEPDIIIFLTSNWEWFYNKHLNIEKEEGKFYDWD